MSKKSEECFKNCIPNSKTSKPLSGDLGGCFYIQKCYSPAPREITGKMDGEELFLGAYYLLVLSYGGFMDRV